MGIIKRRIAICLIFLMCINSFAAVVSDNDGSAFITKAEFDSLKNNFQSQIDTYNQSIDSKIDGAIASYLSGIRLSRTTSGRFYDGLGSKVLVVRTTNVNNLKRGFPGINYLSLTSSMATKSGNSCTTWSVQMLRDMPMQDEFSTEIFRLQGGVLSYYSDNWNCSLTTTISNVLWTTPGTYSFPTFIGLRWHGNQNRPSSGPTKTEDRDDGERTYYATRVGYRNYMLFWGSRLNTGSMFADQEAEDVEFESTSGTPIGRNTYTSAMTEKDGFNRYTFLLDTSPKNTYANIWSSYDMDTKYISADTDPTALGYMNYYDNSKAIYTLPSDTIATLSTIGKAFMLTAVNTGKYKVTSIDGWVTLGGPTGSYSTEYSHNPWIEPAPMLSQYYSSDVINGGVADAQLTRFSSTGWTGKITEGIPIDMFNGVGHVEFDIDLSSLYNMDELCLALKTSPFVFDATTGIEDTNSPELSNLKLDNVSLSAGKTVWENISKTTHTISFDYDMGTAEKAIFLHVGQKRTKDTSVRQFLTLPTQYELTTSD